MTTADEWLRLRALAWLGLDRTKVVVDPQDDPIGKLRDDLHGIIGGVKRRLTHVEVVTQRLETDTDNTLGQITELQSKFDALMEMWGVTVVFDTDGPAKIVSARENGLLADSSRYFEATRLAERFLDVIYELTLELNRDMKRWRKP